MAEMSFRGALRLTLQEELQADENVFLMGEDIGAYGGSYSVTKGLFEEFGPERIMDTPISESVIVGAGIGAAMGGLRPIVELMTINFSLLALDQIVNNAAKLSYMSAGQINVPLVIRMASGAGSQLSSQHSQSLEGWFAHIPGIKVVVPYTPRDARGLLKTAFDEQNPVIFIEHTALYARKGEVPLVRSRPSSWRKPSTIWTRRLPASAAPTSRCLTRRRSNRRRCPTPSRLRTPRWHSSRRTQ